MDSGLKRFTDPMSLIRFLDPLVYKVIEGKIMISWNGMQNTRIMYSTMFGCKN